MSRRRSQDPAIPISIAIPRSLHTRLSEELGYKQSRSRWVSNAILAKLDAHDDQSMIIDNLSSLRLCAILLNRQIISPGMFESLRAVIKAVSPAEEIEEER